MASVGPSTIEGGRGRPTTAERSRAAGEAVSGRAERSVCRQSPPVSRRSLRFLSLVFQALIFSRPSLDREPFHTSSVPPYTRAVYTPLTNVVHSHARPHCVRRSLFPSVSLPPPPPPPSRLRVSTAKAATVVSMSIRGRRPSLPSAPRMVVRRCA